MGKEFSLEPVEVPLIETRHRRIRTPIPAPESLELLENMRRFEPRSMSAQPPIVWQRGEGFHVFDPYGNRWLDFSSGVLVTASGHGHPQIKQAIVEMAEQGLYHAYCFPTEIRARLVEKIVSLLPDELNRVFLLTTGSEAIECCIKLARTHGRAIGPNKNVLVSFIHAFHGRTMGAQLAGGIPGLKSWMGELDRRFVQVPYPDEYRTRDNTFSGFERALGEQGIDAECVCGVLSETYQGVNAKLWPVEYARAMRRWCDRNGALLIFDEVQAGFGRTGKWFGFEHYGIEPDLAAFGKGIAGGMPLSAVAGKESILNLYGPGEMTSTHSANPICSAAALANIEVIETEGLVENAARLAPILKSGLEEIQSASSGHIGRVDSVGLVGALQFTHRETTEPDPDAAWLVTKKCIEAGLMLFAPVGVGGGAIKLNPPLTITEEALLEGISVVRQAVAQVCAEGSIGS